MSEPELKTLAEQFDAFVPNYAGYMKTCIASVHLTLTQLNALRAVDKHAEASMSEIAKALRLTPYAVTKIVDALEKDTLVERKPHPADRRSVLVQLTEVGKEFLAAGIETRMDALERMLSVLSVDERRQLDQILKKMDRQITGDP